LRRQRQQSRRAEYTETSRSSVRQSRNWLLISDCVDAVNTQKGGHKARLILIKRRFAAFAPPASAKPPGGIHGNQSLSVRQSRNRLLISDCVDAVNTQKGGHKARLFALTTEYACR